MAGAGQSAVKKFLPCGARFRVSVMVFIIFESLKYWNGLISDASNNILGRLKIWV